MSELCIVVSPEITHYVRRGLQNLNLNDASRRLRCLTDENCVAIPIRLTTDNKTSAEDEAAVEKMLTEKLRSIFDRTKFEIRKMTLPAAKKLNIKSPENQLKQQIKAVLKEKGIVCTNDLLQDLPTHWERHGDLILVPSSAFTSHMWLDIGDKVWEITTRCLSCRRLAQKRVVSTDGYRTPQVRMLYGTDSWVEQVDNGIRYTYDITRCMFSSGNISEKLRVAKFDCTDEVVVDLYAGIGYFTLPYLVCTGVKHLHACEWNPDAVEALCRNLILNNVQDRCTVHKGDNRKMCPKGVADRVNLGLIPSSRDGWPVACAALKPKSGGILHIHFNVNTKQGTENGDKDSEKYQPAESFRREAKCLTPSQTGDSLQTLNRYAGLLTCDNDKLPSAIENPHTGSCCGSSSKSENNPKSVPGGSKGTNTLSRYSQSEIQDLKKSKTTIVRDTEDTGEYVDNSTNKSHLKQSCDTDKCLDKEQPRVCSQKHKSYNSKASCTDKVLDDINSTEKTLNGEDYADIPDDSKTVASKSVEDDLGIEHVYKKVSASKWFPWAYQVAMEIRTILEDLHSNQWTTEILHIEHVKSYAPYIDHVVLDLNCKPV